MKFTHLKSLTLILVSAWFSMTCLIDFVAVPLLFRNIPSAEVAGKIGIKIFSTFNTLEMGLGMTSAIFMFLMFKGDFRRKVTVLTMIGIMSATLVTVAYNIHVTPAIVEYSTEMRSHPEESPAFKNAEEVHEFYHQLYVKLDGLKLILLLLVLIGLVTREDPELLEARL